MLITPAALYSTISNTVDLFHFEDVFYMISRNAQVWIGLTDEDVEGIWMFTDGTTLPDGITVNSNGSNAENGGLLTQNDGIVDGSTDQQFQYICMTDRKCVKFCFCVQISTLFQ